MINTENLMEIQLSLSSPTYRGPKGDKPVKGVDYFTQEDINDIVSQIEIGEISLEGYASKEYVDEAIENIDIPEVDLSTYASKTYVDNAVEGMVVNETDPTVPAWAKQPNKPAYTASEVGALPADTQLFSGNYNDLSNKPAIPTVPVNVSAFNNDAGYLTSHQSLTDYATKAYVDDAIADIPAGGITVETDPTVPSWAKQATKPTYTANEVGALPADTVLFSGSYNDLTDKPTIPEVPANVSAFNNDAGYLTSHQSLTDYATKSYVETAIRGAESGLLKRSVVQALPVSDIDEDTIYMVAKTGSTGDVYDEYLYVNSNWEHIGSTDVDLTDYQKVIKIEVPNLVLSSNNPDILTEEQQNIIFDIYSKFINNEPIPDIYINGQRILFYNTNPAVTSSTTLFRLYSLSYPLAQEKYQISNGISYQFFEVVINEDNTGLNSNRLYWKRISQTAKDIKLNNNISLDGITRTYSNVEDALSALAYYYASKSYVDTAIGNIDIPAPIVIQVGIAGQPSIVDGVYTLPLTITSNNMAEAYAQYQTHPSTVGMAVDLTALGRATKMYLDCESFYRYGNDDSGYTYETYGEFNDNSLSQSFGYEFMNVNIHLNTGELGSKGTLAGLATKSYVDTAIADMPDVEVVRVPFNQTFATTSEIGKKLYALNQALNNHTQTPNYIIILTDGYVDYQVVHYEGYTAMPYPTLWTLQDTNDGFRVFAHPFNSNNGYVKNGGYVKSNYILPTATTSTLGGVKVDGTTITISNGVISATSSGGSYTAGQGISIDNGEISVDFGNEIEDGGFSFAQHYDNEDYYEYTSNIYPYEINITSYGEADPETGDQETKSISITGEGITFDDTGDSHTLGISNGELVFDDSPIGSGGGSSYTAGNGIEIDSNGVISREGGAYPLFGLLLNLFTDPRTASYNQNNLIRQLNLGRIGNHETVEGHIQNLQSYGMTIINDQTTANNMLQILSALDPTITSTTTEIKQWGGWSQVPSQYSIFGSQGTRTPNELAGQTGSNYGSLLIIFDNKQPIDSYYRWGFISKPQILFQNIYFNSQNSLTSNSIAGAIDELATRIPSAPTTDGNYVLKVSVSSGTPTYSWVAE